MEDWRLLREYLERGSETAFAALVERHIHLVYSAALRRLGDPHAAEDVTQAVFCLLAQKARRLRPGTVLMGWLYQTACFKASKYQRGEFRQRQREREAVLMQSIDSTADPAWEQITPHLEDAMSRLGEQDRLAVLLRFFQRKPLKEVGEALGVSEDAARMRVDRALDKLRALLANRGVTSTAMALAALLADGAVGTAPAGLAATVSHAALLSVMAGTGITVMMTKLMSSLTFKLAVGTAVLVAVALLVPRATDDAQSPTANSNGAKREFKNAAVPANRDVQASVPAAMVAASNRLLLHIVTAESNSPIAGAVIDYELTGATNRVHQPFISARDGTCEIPVPRDTFTSLLLTSQIDSFADTSLLWRVDRGEKVPQAHTLRLTRSVWVGGRVVDAEGQPVEGATVVFGSGRPSPDSRTAVEFHAASRFETRTDVQGRWSLNRMAPEVFRRIESAGANHRERGSSARLSVVDDPDAQKQLLAGTYAFHLEGVAGSITVSGIVVDESGQPVTGARMVLSPGGFSGRGVPRTAISQSDGTFTMAGCTPEQSLLAVNARGFLRTNMDVQISSNLAPINVTLQRGSLVRIRVVDGGGSPVPKASISLRLAEESRGQEASIGAIGGRGFRGRGNARMDFGIGGQTDADGWFEWGSAPDVELSCTISAIGYGETNLQVKPGPQEQVVTLTPFQSLTLYGTVRDAATGETIPRFRITPGTPSVNRTTGVTNGLWDKLSWKAVEGSPFRYLYRGTEVSGLSEVETNVMFKFEADGYAPFVTRVIRVEEREVQVEVALRPAASISVKVLLPDGRPAANVDVGLLSSVTTLTLTPSGFNVGRGGGYSTSMGTVLTTDDQGRFVLAPDEEMTLVVVPHRDGYAEATPAALAVEPTLRLQPWSQLEGTFTSGGRPAGGRTLSLTTTGTRRSQLWLDPESYRVETDAAGHFAFPKVPTGEFVLLREAAVASSSRPSPMSWRPPLTQVTVHPAEAQNVAVGAYTVTARLGWPANLKREANWYLQVWFLHIAATRSPSMEFAEIADGSFVAEDVPAGNYSIRVRVSEALSTTGRGRLRARAEVPFTVPTDPITGTLDLGEIVLLPAQ